MLLLKGGTVLTMGPMGVLRQGDVLIDGGKIVSTAEQIEPQSGWSVIDVKGMYVLPGLVDPHSHAGGMKNEPYHDDLNEMSSPVQPEMNSYYGIDPEDPIFRDLMQDGITSCCVVPGSGNVIGGVGIVLKSAGETLDGRVIRNPAVLKAAAGVNPKAVYASKSMAPMTRMSWSHMLRSYFRRVREYMDDKAAGKKPAYDQGLENGALVLNRQMPLKVHAYQHDMMSVLDIAKEFDFLVTLDHAQGASDFLEELQDPHVAGVIFGPVVMGLAPGEPCKADYAALPLLDQRGVLTAVNTDAPAATGQTLIFHVGEAVRAGMEPERAVAMVTINAAKILGCEDRIGSLEPGKDADIAVYSGYPGLDVTAENRMTIVDGNIVFDGRGQTIC